LLRRSWAGKKHEFGSWNAECGKHVMTQGLTFYLTPCTFYLFFGVGAAVYLLTFYPGRAPNTLCRMPIPSFYLSTYTLYPIPYTLYPSVPRAPNTEYRKPSLSFNLTSYTLNPEPLPALRLVLSSCGVDLSRRLVGSSCGVVLSCRSSKSEAGSSKSEAGSPKAKTQTSEP